MAVDIKILGKRIQMVRKEQKLTQEALAEKLNVSVGYISQIERGITKPNLDMLAEICGVLQTNIGYLVSGVIRNEDHYLTDEAIQQFRLLTDKEKNVVVSLMQAIVENR